MAARIWVTADTHLQDAAAIALFGRPFVDAKAMDEALLEGINRRVGRRDLLLHLGDVFGALEWSSKGARKDARALLGRIRCRRIALVRGNQDPDRRSFARHFEGVESMLRFRMPDPSRPGTHVRVVCCHYPLLQWQGMFTGALHLHGHAHGSLAERARTTDVGVDCWNYEPVPLETLAQFLCERPAPTGVFARLQPMRRADA